MHHVIILAPFWMPLLTCIIVSIGLTIQLIIDRKNNSN